MGQLRLEELLWGGESDTLEFKKSLGSTSKGLEALCAMVNSDKAQGMVVFGVGPDGTAYGVDPGNLDKAQRSLSQTIRNKFDPPLLVQMEINELNDLQVLLLSAKRDRSIPYHEYDGRAWIRQGTVNRILSLAEKRQLSKMRDRDTHLGPWICNRCGSRVGVLHSFIVTNEGMKKTYNCECGGEFWPDT